MKKTWKSLISAICSVESFFTTIIRRTYPFVHHTAEGKKLFLEAAYDSRSALAGAKLRQAPYSKESLPLTVWKNFLELWASVLFWTVASTVERIVGLPLGFILPILVIIYFSYQELYIDGELGRKNWAATIVGFILWVGPSLWFIISLII